ncbi:hypothetical protein [Tessaracoccus palaemonis]|uniref:Uncharacterized protein n=1 Tax=Tessaracoccus palaemonis TaxID=2829499 RepID=A0ABX8SHR6_9ACTN|nr:hypothetical protein [Tessaracoccus palaemonis]QXT62937.1 hypothetical protein KDB89_00125 [Tessaracoccus palaemonis]
MHSKLSGPLQGGLVGLSRRDAPVRVLSDDGPALLVLDRGRLRWVPRRDAVAILEPGGAPTPERQAEVLARAPFPGLDGGLIRVDDWVGGQELLPTMGPSGIAEVVAFASFCGSLHVEVARSSGGTTHERLVRVYRALRRGLLTGPDGDADPPAHPIEYYRCHVCGLVPAPVSSLTGIAIEHGGPKAQRCPMSGRRLIDPPA